MDLNDLMRQRGAFSPGLWKAQVFLGIALLVFGTAVLIFPPILTYLVSGLCVLLGFVLISLGLKLKRMSSQLFGGGAKTEVFTRR
ncbi:MAG: hypothetical protein JNM84_06315 [Planctomycetes bacterium]|nr:hypothetical protein [Planctomycetota bacterium]